MDQRTVKALERSRGIMASLLNANRATIDMPQAYWDRLFDAYRETSDLLHDHYNSRPDGAVPPR